MASTSTIPRRLSPFRGAMIGPLPPDEPFDSLLQTSRQPCPSGSIGALRGSWRKGEKRQPPGRKAERLGWLIVDAEGGQPRCFMIRRPRPLQPLRTDWAAASRATGTRNGEQLT